MSAPTLKIDWCTHAAAKYAVEHWHYSGSLPANKSVRLGVWEGGVYVGCVIFGWGANRNMAGSIGLQQTECAELTRVALTQHQTPVSRIIAIAVRLLKKQSPGVRALISYADPNRGHHGGIYQAGGWIHTGVSHPNESYSVNGKTLHKRMYTGTNFGQPAKPLPPGAVKFMPIPKYRYVLPLDPVMRAQIAPLAKPYPKRAGSACAGKSSPVGTTDGEDGAAPIPALHRGGA
jgi:hypothetical protein